MAIIQGGRWEAYFRRMFSLKGKAEPQSVSPELIGTATVVPPRAEDSILRGDKLMWGKISQGGVAGEYSYNLIYNNSENYVVTVDRVMLRSGSGPMVVTARAGNVLLGIGPNTVGGRDMRLGATVLGNQAAAVLYVGSLVAATGTEVANHRLESVWSEEFMVTPFVLPPSYGLFIFGGTVNSEIRTSFLWTERVAEPGELNLQQ